MTAVLAGPSPATLVVPAPPAPPLVLRAPGTIATTMAAPPALTVTLAGPPIPALGGRTHSAYGWAGSAQGSAPYLQGGTAQGVYGWAGAAVGITTRAGTITGQYGWIGAAAGGDARIGAAQARYTWAGSAQGAVQRAGTASGAYGWASSAQGAQQQAGTAHGSYGWAGAAQGATTRAGAAQGVYGWASTAHGAQQHAGTAQGTFNWRGAATGAVQRAGTGQGTYRFASSAHGTSSRAGTASGTYRWAGAAAGAKPVSQPTIVGANHTDVSPGTTSASVTIPAHQAGDLILIFAFVAGYTVPAQTPAAGGTVPNWTQIDAKGGAVPVAGSTFYAIAAGTNDTSGTWTTPASNIALIAMVLRGQSSTTPIGAHAEANSSSTQDSPVAPAITLQQTDGSSALVHLFGINNGAQIAPAWSAPPTGYTTRTSGGYFTYSLTKNVTTSDGSVQLTNNLIGNGAPNNMAYAGASVEIRAH